ncbi:MAG: TIGR04283 family arsenosugar biosynthesis glycosyltransferase [Desulfobacteraceae bacterium]|nr:TIGR04283 family arsenosugar biosynthesis glycosyltransferase [Desulfobacteraceae bacterium]
MKSFSIERRLILFGRYPVPGLTKTRLIPVVGPLGAAELQRQWTEHILTIFKRANLAPVDFVFSGGARAQMRRWVGQDQVHLRAQAEGDLGRRMRLAMAHAFAQGASQVVLMGTDIPELTIAHLTEAFSALAERDVVLGPSTDGGYWLVGSRRPVEIFDGIAWGTAEALKQTLARLEQQGLSVTLLQPLHDIDCEADLRAWQPQGGWTKPFLSIIIPTLNEAEQIAQTIAHVKAADIEVIVADGGSQDETPALAHQAGAKVIQAPKGRARQQNQGARASQGQALLFLHADTRLPSDFGAQVFEVLLNPDVALGAFHFRTDWDHWAMPWIEWAANVRSRWLKMPYGDQAMFMRRTRFDQIGGFPDAPIAEDLYLARKMGRKGRVELAPGVAITSGRRWRSIGIARTTWINYRIALGCLLGTHPRKLASLYQKDKRS